MKANKILTLNRIFCLFFLFVSILFTSCRSSHFLSRKYTKGNYLSFRKNKGAPSPSESEPTSTLTKKSDAKLSSRNALAETSATLIPVQVTPSKTETPNSTPAHRNITAEKTTQKPLAEKFKPKRQVLLNKSTEGEKPFNPDVNLLGIFTGLLYSSALIAFLLILLTSSISVFFLIGLLYNIACIIAIIQAIILIGRRKNFSSLSNIITIICLCLIFLFLVGVDVLLIALAPALAV